LGDALGDATGDALGVVPVIYSDMHHDLSSICISTRRICNGNIQLQIGLTLLFWIERPALGLINGMLLDDFSKHSTQVGK
jgi:hypothetical protein